MRPGINTSALTLGALVLAVAAALTVRFVIGPVQTDPGLPGGAAVQSYAEVQAQTGAPRLVSLTEVAAAGKGSPGQAVLRFWRSVQLGAGLGRIASSFAPEAGVDPARLSEQLTRLRYAFDQSKPLLVDAEVHERSARVVAVISTVGEDERGRPIETHALETFELTRAADDWRLRDNRYLERRYAAELAYGQELQDARRR